MRFGQRKTVVVLCKLSSFSFFFPQACAEGYFGNSCRFRCKCEATQACDHVTGHCISPTCQAGFTGPTCKHRKNAI